MRDRETATVVLGALLPARTVFHLRSLTLEERGRSLFALWLNMDVYTEVKRIDADTFAAEEVPEGPLRARIVIDDFGGRLAIEKAVAIAGAGAREVEIALPAERGRIFGRLAALTDSGSFVEAVGDGADATVEVRDGFFRFPPLPPGRYTVGAAGCAPREVDLAAGAGVEVVLEPLGR